jgi:hypothetical protein
MNALTSEQRKELIKVYPYLMPRNVWTDEIASDYNYDHIRGEFELPPGWERLFLLYCMHLKPILVKHNYVDKFRFTQIKEKYGRLRMYDNGSPTEGHNLESVFGAMSGCICEYCGKKAAYETHGWIEVLCKEHITKQPSWKKHRIRRKRVLTIERFDYSDNKNGEKYVVKIPLTPYWKEYNRCIKMSDEEFYNYIIQGGQI